MPIFAILLLLGSYMMFADTFHSFIHWLLDQTFDALQSSFGTGGKEGATGASGLRGKK